MRFLVFLFAVSAIAQNADKALSFEVASIRPNQSGNARSPSAILPGGHFTATNNSVRELIQNAYGLFATPSLLQGGPGWIDSERYDIDARAADGVIPAATDNRVLWEKTRLMLRALLVDRFKLAIHRETKEMSIYELVVAKGGPKLKPSTADCVASTFACHGMSGNPRRMTFTGVDMYDVALILTGYSDRPVVDKTGVSGIYDLLLKWNPFAGRPDSPPNDTAPPPQAAVSKEGNGPMPDAASLPSIFDALQQEAGLRLQAQKGPVDGWVIDSVERPSGN